MHPSKTLDWNHDAIKADETNGQIVGLVNGSGGRFPFVYTNDTPLIVPIPAADYNVAKINNLGVLGATAADWTPVLYANGVVQQLPLAGCDTAVVIDLNDSGVVTGQGSGGACGNGSTICT